MGIMYPIEDVWLMKIQTAKQILQLQKRASQVDAQVQSGLTVKQWCMQNDVEIKTFYQRRKRVHEEMLEAMGQGNALQLSTASQKHQPHKTKELPVFAPLPRLQAASAAVTVRLGEYAVEIQNGADDMVVEQVLRLMARL